MRDEAEDFLETAHPDALRQIARARELTRDNVVINMNCTLVDNAPIRIGS